MLRRNPTFVVLVSALALLAACATSKDVLIDKRRGRARGRYYPIAPEQAWLIAKTVLELEPTDKIDEQRAEGYMLTSQNDGPLSASTYLGVFIEPAPNGAGAEVAFVARRKTPTQSYPYLTEQVFFHKFETLVALVETVHAVGDASDAGVIMNDAASEDETVR